MFFSDLLPQIDPKWHEAFVRFIETGQASEDFRTYLNTDKSCQDAMERLLASHIKTLRPFIEAATVEPMKGGGKAATGARNGHRR